MVGVAVSGLQQPGPAREADKFPVPAWFFWIIFAIRPPKIK